MRFAVRLIGVACMVFALAASAANAIDPLSPTTTPVPPSLASTIARVEAKARYTHSTWAQLVADAKSGEVLVSQNPEKLFTPGSTLKLYSAAAVLHDYGAGHRFRTPVYRTGSVRRGVLSGNLVLVGSGDFSFGLRDRANGTQAYNSAPQLDHSDADGSAGPTLVPHSNPLAGVEQLARQVRAAGIRRVNGNVVVDDRLFNAYTGWPDGVVSPIGVNENFLDITARPTRRGQTARISYRPRTAAWHVRSTVKTAPRGAAPSWQATQTGPGEVTVSGTVPAGAGPLLQVFFIPNPAAFARTAFIEALRRAGVSVPASAGGSNPRNLLPRSRSYPSSHRVALRSSAPLSQIVKVILKVSANRGADLLVCLVAAKHGQRNCLAGLAYLQRNAARLGSPPDTTFAFDGAGSDDRDRINPVALTTFLRRVLLQPYGSAFRAALPLVGVNGTLAQLGKGTPAVGKIEAKPGNRVAFATPALGIAGASNLVGYIEAKSGRTLVFANLINNIPLTAVFSEVFSIFDDQMLINEAVQQAY
ncbi:MAG TPA: D-alanyl-D-alanine carboxypeptidase/D-alanyl-D-alanine-endopeptidase [Solirubrobacteraceae bacterium]|jgi:D-alanyl-D-alanine carboxypeptidase/D-alanyl-D-alanine-endopeptidase (penicillin-binding protein 4)